MNQPDDIADGRDHQLDPRIIPLKRLTGGLFAAAVVLGSLAALALVLLVGDDIPRSARMFLPVAWAAFAAFMTWFAYRWPAIRYQHASYRVDDQGIEIRAGVFWRVVLNVPKSRVQHIDVSQGPLDRRYELGTLVIYTAGTDHAKVTLEGLAHGRALRIREHLLPSGAGDAV